MRRVGAFALFVASSSCTTDAPTGNPTRETLPNGATLVRYPELPAIDSVGPEITDVEIDLQFGSREGDDPNLTFGNIRGNPGSERRHHLRAGLPGGRGPGLSPDGEYLRTIARRGEGPGEIAEANGIILSGDTLLWIHDYFQNRIEGVDPVGAEVRWFTKPVFGYGYIWDGTFDRQGRYWKETSHRDDDEGDRGDPEPGLLSSTSRLYFKSHELSTEQVDSVYMGETTSRAYRSAADWGAQIPFDPPTTMSSTHPGGSGSANTGSYRLTRTGEGGDTLLVIEASLPGIPVTSDDRSAYVERWAEREPEYRRGLRSGRRPHAGLQTHSPGHPGGRRGPAMGAENRPARRPTLLRPVLAGRRLSGFGASRFQPDTGTGSSMAPSTPGSWTTWGCSLS